MTYLTLKFKHEFVVRKFKSSFVELVFTRNSQVTNTPVFNCIKDKCIELIKTCSQLIKNQAFVYGHSFWCFYGPPSRHSFWCFCFQHQVDVTHKRSCLKMPQKNYMKIFMIFVKLLEHKFYFIRSLLRKCLEDSRKNLGGFS